VDSAFYSSDHYISNGSPGPQWDYVSKEWIMVNERVAEHDTHLLDCQAEVSKFNVTVNKTSKEESSQILSFKDQNAAYTYEVGSMPDPTFGAADMDDVSLGDFFSRPIKIVSYQWTNSTNFYQDFDPWNLYFTNPRVSNRISNFYLMRCKLHLKFMINGNGFYYGRLLANYKPLDFNDDFTVDRALITQDNVAASQRPHVYLDPTTSAGGDMILPFVWDYNACRLPLGDFSRLGAVSIRTLTDLKHANGASDPITISVFAWAEDMHLSTPTVQDSLGLTPQMEETILDPQADEYGTGPISRPASIVANWMGKLRDAPVIGMYARATELAASAVSGVAQIFGYSRPAVLDDIVPYRPTYVGNLANTNIPDSTTKLALDCKQEVTIDPRTMGLGATDEMTICSISTRESYLTSFTWGVAAIPETSIWVSQVTPMLWAENTNLGNTELHLPACAFATLPFKHWRGSMRFRFQVVSSNFHKGRLAIMYDPASASSFQYEYNTNYTRVIDIAEEKDFTVEIGWGSSYPYLECQIPGATGVTLPYSNALLAPVLDNFCNGYLSVRVLNELTVPNSTVDNDVQINVFVSTGDDFEVFNPTDEGLRAMTYFPDPTLEGQGEITFLDPQASVEEVTDLDNAPEASKPMQENNNEEMAATLDLRDGMSSICFGERIVSMRQCLKRYQLSTAYSLSGSRSLFKRVINDFFGYRGYSPTGIHSTSTADPYNYYFTDLLHYLTPAYVARRGAIRKKFLYNGQGQSSGGTRVETDQMYMSVTRVPTDQSYQEGYVSQPTTTTIESAPYDLIQNESPSWPGSHVTIVNVNPALEVEFPYQQNRRFLFARSNITSDTDGQGMEVTANVFNVSGYVSIREYTSVGEDFQLSFFMGAPIMYYQLANPIP
jgi:hypothetical protein